VRIRPFRDLPSPGIHTGSHSSTALNPSRFSLGITLLIWDIVEGVVVRSPYCNPILIFTPLVPEIIQHEAAMHFGDEVSHVVYKSVAEDSAYGSVDGVEPGLCGRFEDRESPIAHEKLSHRFKTRDGL